MKHYYEDVLGHDWYCEGDICLCTESIGRVRFGGTNEYEGSALQRAMQDFHPAAFALSAEEAEAFPRHILSCGAWWWLRSPGFYSSSAANVGDGDNVYCAYSVRPALPKSVIEALYEEVHEPIQQELRKGMKE